MKKALRRVSASQDGCGLILRIGDWSEEYQGRGLWLVQARRGELFMIDEATQTVTEFSPAADHTHDAYACHPSRG